jgi:hypothetical protein
MSTHITPRKKQKSSFFFLNDYYKSFTKAYEVNRIILPLQVIYKVQIDNKQYEIQNFVYDVELILDQFRDNMYL